MDTGSPTPTPPLHAYQLPACDATVREVAGEDTFDALRDRALLRQNAHWFCHLRWIVSGGLAMLAVAGVPEWTTAIGLSVRPTWPLAAASLLAAVNLVYETVLRRWPRDTTAGRIRLLLWIQIVIDLMILTLVTHFVGSTTSYAAFAYLFHIILACIFFPRTESLAIVAVAAVLYAGCLLWEGTDSIPPRTVFAAMEDLPRTSVAKSVEAWRLASLFGIWLIIWYLVSRLSATLRDRERQLAVTNRRLEASSQERARHMLQTTHELKSPFAAIHANAQLLLGGFAGELPESARAVVYKISQRASMLSQRIQDMLQLTNLRSQAQAPPSPTRFDLGEIIRTIVARAEPVAALRGIRIQADVEAVLVRSVEDYWKMLIENLLSNAINYSRDGGVVNVLCRREQHATARVAIEDRGIGIPADKLEKIFQDYYRTQEAAQHNPSSTGLGLAVVRQVAHLLRMSVTVESALGWGTRFTLLVPTCTSHVEDS